MDEIFEIHDHWLETACNIGSELIECGVPFLKSKAIIEASIGLRATRLQLAIKGLLSLSALANKYRLGIGIEVGMHLVGVSVDGGLRLGRANLNVCFGIMNRMLRTLFRLHPCRPHFHAGM